MASCFTSLVRSASLLFALTLLLHSVARQASSESDSLQCDDIYDYDDGIVFSPGSPTCHAQDREALLKFKASISADPNKALADWGASHYNCCDWNGVSCDGATGRVVRLKLPSQGLQGTIAPELAQLSQLQVLLLYDNDFNGSLPSTLGNLKRLQRLCLSGSASLSGPIPESLGNLSSLQLLDLSGNSLSGPLPLSIGGLLSLGKLYLNGNRLTGTFPPSFSSLSHLYDASFAYNQLSGRIPDSFGHSLTSLISFYLNNNRITGLPADLSKLTQLQYINLAHNPIRNSDAVAGIVTAPMMSEIDLSYCNLSGPFPSWVARFPHITSGGLNDELFPSIDLSNNNLWGNIPASPIGRLPYYIQSVALNNNRFSGRIPATFANLTQLYSLLLQHNQLTGTIPAAFSALNASLNLLNVSYNQLSGSIPQVVPFTTFSVSSYTPGNPGLCGSPLLACKSST